MIVVLDPGHNPNNWRHPRAINRLVWIVTEWKACDTTGTETNSGYTEADFNYNVAIRAKRILNHLGARVVLTRGKDTPAWGPCINRRAAIANNLHANVALSIHADGGPPGGRGFQVILPAPVGPNDRMIHRSDIFGHDLHNVFHRVTGEPYANYLGGGTGYTRRNDLGGLNLSTVPKVFIECGNMRNAADAAKLERRGYRELVARGIALGIERYLTTTRQRRH